MTWKINLRQASFRGVRFHVRDRGLSTGREIQNHEFPKRNTNFPEDMGKKSRTFSADAYVIGDDYMSQRDALVQACEREGAGQFIDHWGRSQRVVCTACELKETVDEGRLARFSLSFTEAGAGAMPAAVVATAAQLAGAAGSLSAASIISFARLGIVTQNKAVLAASIGMTIGGLPASITARVGGTVIGR